MEKPWYIFIIFSLGALANCYKIVKGPSDLIKNFTSTDQDSYEVFLKENNHINGSNHLLLFTISEVNIEPQWSFSVGSFTYKMEKVDDVYEFYITQYIDYEMETTHSYLLLSYISSTYLSISLNTINYDDEPPTLTAPMCSMQENTDYDEANTECTSILSDPDGWLSQTTFSIINSNPSATDVWAKEDQLFQFTFDKTISDTVYNTTVFLTTRKQLDYEKKIFYSFVVQAKDGAGHNTAPKENVSCIVDVIDLNDTPPQWTEYFSTKQITEKLKYTFEVTAVDGDRGRNVAINYDLISYDEDVCQGACVNIKTNDGKAIIEVEPIDRDAKDLSTYKFEIMAIKDDDPPYNVTLPITFYVDDIDDNSPLFLNITGTNFSAIFVNEDTKIIEFSFFENYAGTIDGQILIQDIDTGENAQFAVELKEDDSKVFDVTYTDAFLIVPNAGYRRGEFKITVQDSKYLDFENIPWQNFSFYVHSSGTKNQSRNDDLLVKIHLLDYNDELPIFDEDSYVAEVEETIDKGETILKVRATDRDAEDATLEYQLIGANVTTSLMNIDTNGTITVAVHNAFDYDRLNEIILQVQASDKVQHRTTVPITIKLLDVNNKAPTYKVNEIIRVDENQPIGTMLNATVIASDVDTTRNLTADIDWVNSYAMKNSQKLNSSIPDIKKAMEFLDISFNKTSQDSITIKLIVNDNNTDETAPDYETFDTLYLNIIITDLNTKLPEFEDQMSINALITVNINDINDNAPEFTDDTLKKIRSVYEKSEVGTIAGTIEAIDLDVGDKVSYSCKYMTPELDWFECSEGGEISTKTNGVDADHGFKNGFVYNVSINCSATDQFWYTYQVFNINIVDKNDQKPQIKVKDTLPSAQEVEVYEKSDPDTVVAPIGYKDDDRDEPFHTVSCQINRTEECFESFKVENNILKVLNGHEDIDRDRKKQTYSCKLICYDNPNLEQGGVQNENSTTEFTIKLLDINDNDPELVTEKLEINENMKQGQIIGKVIGADWDEGDNAEIDMNILAVTKLNDADAEEKDYKDLFEMYKNDSDYYRDNITEKQWYFLAGGDLRDHYGEYTVHLNLSDWGSPQRSKTGTFSLSILRYNYYPPEFVFPDKSRTNFSLSSDQEPNTQLVMYYNNETFSNIEIKDSEGDETCIEKWEPKFEVTLIEKSASLNNFFTLQPLPLERCVAILQVKDTYNKNEAIDNSPYQLRLTATLADATPLDGEAAYSTYVDLKISFINLIADPEFDQSLGPWNISFLEDNSTQLEPLPEIREAFYPNLVDSKDIPKYYFLISDEDNVKNSFDVKGNNGAVSLRKKLDYLEAKYYEFKILASRNQTKTLKEKSLMNVTVYVIDINNHVPQWTQEVFFGAILKSDQKGRTIVTLNATDLDEIDKDKLTYTLDSNIESYGSENLKKIDTPFLVDNITGAITLNFKVDYNMNGYFTFWVKVQDVPDDYGNGPFANRTSVLIYIVTDDNTVGFKFENPLDDVVGMKLQILDDISTSLGYECHEQTIDNDSKNGVVLTNVSVVNVYCVNNNTLLTANDINRKLNNINVFQLLKKRLLSNGLLLQNFNDDSSSSLVNLESSLKAALIGVTVVLGALCLILGVTFFLKTRELSRRLKKLTQPKFGSDESTINRQGIKAPTTNEFAVEGSNPVFNTTMLKDDLMKADTFSIHSGNSDLIGVEDNPEFDEMFGKEKY